MKTVLVLAALCCAVSAQVKRPDQAPPARPPFAASRQAVVVTTPDWPSVAGTARLFERRSTRSAWRSVGEPFQIVVGRNGLAWSPEAAVKDASEVKKEGDGRSPAGLFPLTFAFGSSPRPGIMRLPFKPVTAATECVDDVNSNHYNKIVDRMKVGNLDWNSSEKMLEVGEPYGLGVFVAYNSYPPRSGNGSCIFLHIWNNAETGTSGCTAMDRANIERLLGWLDPAAVPYLIQLPEKQYKHYQRTWKLPKL